MLLVRFASKGNLRTGGDIVMDEEEREARRLTAIDDRRQATRFRREEEEDSAAIWYPPGVEMMAQVYDESLHGIALIVDDAKEFKLGLQVEIAYAGSFLLGTVRHIEDYDGRTKIGFQTTRITDRNLDND